jgi:hypothetical protein
MWRRPPDSGVPAGAIDCDRIALHLRHRPRQEAAAVVSAPDTPSRSIPDQNNT